VSTAFRLHCVCVVLGWVVALAACGGGAADGLVCSGAGVCGAGRVCVASRCRPSDANVSPSDARRVVLEPKDLAVLTARDGESVVPDVVALGRAANGSTVLLLRFEASWRDDVDVASAFLVFDPRPGAVPARTTTKVEAARILEPWSSSTVSWGRQPRLGLPELAGAVRPTPSRILRLDVTRWVRDWQKRLPDDHGLAVLTDGGDVFGSTYSTGLTQGTPPRLEAYLR
jgi:hypothetical protein